MRRRLTLLALAVTSMVVIAFLVPLTLLVRSQAEQRALDTGQQTARAVASGLAVASSIDGGLTNEAVGIVLATSGDESTSVFLPDGTVLGAPAARSSAVELAATGRALTADAEGGVEVLVPLVGMEEPVVVRTFVTEATLGEGVLRAVLVLILLGLILIGAAVALADRLGRTLVRPVADLADAARQMAGGDLGARVRPGGPPELADVGAAFNQMAERVTDLIEEERESLADLSHALRTPLTSLRLQVEAIDDTEAAGSMAQDLDRLSARVDGLISEARRLSPSAGRRETDLCAVVRDRFTFWGVLAEEQGREHHVTVPPGSLPVALTEDEAAVMIDTLLENVFTHTAPGTGYRVTIQGAGGGALLAVEDEGDGFPSRDVVARGTSGAGSTGLGLDIVRRAAERSGGGITLTSGPGGGARIEVVLGGPRLPAPR